MEPQSIVRQLKRKSSQKLWHVSGSLTGVWTVGRSVTLILLTILIAACGATTGPDAGAGQSEATLVLPTSKPTPAPSPISTRVLPLEEFTPTPTSFATPTITPIPDEVRGLVVNVISGDTISVVLEGDPPNRVYQVRYIGIEAPPNESDNPWGVTAYETNRKMTNMKVVRLVADQNEVDDEDNLLRYVYVGDELMSIILVEQGLARADIGQANTRFEEEIQEAEARAREGGLGLWGQPPNRTPASTNPSPTATEEEPAEPETTPVEPPTAGTGTTTPENEPAASPEPTGTEAATAEPTP